MKEIRTFGAVSVVFCSTIFGLFLGFVSANILVITKIGGEYKGLAYPFFILGTAIIDGIFGLVIAIFLTTIAQNMSGKVGLVLVSCLAGLIRVMISAIMIYNRTIDGGRDLSGLPPWWYTDQLKILVVDFFGGFLIAFFALMLIRHFRIGGSGSIS